MAKKTKLEEIGALAVARAGDAAKSARAEARHPQGADGQRSVDAEAARTAAALRQAIDHLGE